MPEPTTNTPTLDDASPVVHTEACEFCGAPVEPLDKFCVACGGEQPQAPPEPEADKKHFRCKNCGAEVAIDPEQRSYVCAFCDSHYVIEFTPEASGRQDPEFIIGFSITPEQALARFREWLADGSWFRPADLKSAQLADKLRGVYLPFWSFSMLARSEWNASIGEYWWRTETYTTTQNGKTVTRTRRVRETEWWPLSGRHHNYYSGYLVSASRGLRQEAADRIKPFHLAALRRYEPFYLAGWQSEEYSIGREESLALCEQEFSRRERQNVAAFLPGDTHGGLEVATRFSEAHSDLIFLPVYLLTYRHGKKAYRFLLNGQTGKAAGQKPVSWRKVALAVGLGIGLLGLLVLLLLLSM